MKYIYILGSFYFAPSTVRKKKSVYLMRFQLKDLEPEADPMPRHRGEVPHTVLAAGIVFRIVGAGDGAVVTVNIKLATPWNSREQAIQAFTMQHQYRDNHTITSFSVTLVLFLVLIFVFQVYFSLYLTFHSFHLKQSL